jgi:histidine ammonia-lyase
MKTPQRADTSTPHAIELTGQDLTLDQLDAACHRPLKVSLSGALWKKIADSRARIEKMLATGGAIYGVNTGFGKLCNVRISDSDLAQLQENLILSHAVGVGPPLAPELVRWMMLFKIAALARGASGISPDCVKLLVSMLNADILPVIPSRGSLGASGDLAPLAHMVLGMMGRSQVWIGGDQQSAADALKKAGLSPVILGAKDGLALINGTQMMLAHSAEICVRAARLAKHADLIATMSLEACRGSLKPFDDRLLHLRPHPGALEVGANVRRLMADSEILKSHENCDKVQDPYSLRCVPQVHGACRDALRHATQTMLIEVNSVTDNPLLLDDEAVSGGNFHGEPLALTLDYLAMALTEWASISERRTYLLTTGPDGLPPLLMKNTGINSGFMIPQYTSAALVNECKVLSTPASVDSITSSLGQEDHVSMGATSALKCRQILENAETVLAIEMLCAAQALDFRAPLKPGLGPRAAHETIRTKIPHAATDRAFGEDILTALDILRSQGALRAAQAAAGSLK